MKRLDMTAPLSDAKYTQARGHSQGAISIPLDSKGCRIFTAYDENAVEVGRLAYTGEGVLVFTGDPGKTADVLRVFLR